MVIDPFKTLKIGHVMNDLSICPIGDGFNHNLFAGNKIWYINQPSHRRSD